MIRRPEPDKIAPGQESVWDYPRPPRLEDFSGEITVELGGQTIASTRRSWRVLETSHPPTYYLPRESFSEGVLRPTSAASWCEWKGQASYFDLVADTEQAEAAAWTYLTPTAGFEPIAGAIAVMAAAVDRCTVDGEVGDAAARRLLRRLGDELDPGSVQGRAGVDGLVNQALPDSAARGRAGGTAASSARVYSCSGASNSSAAGRYSTASPSRITSTWWLIRWMTARS